MIAAIASLIHQSLRSSEIVFRDYNDCLTYLCGRIVAITATGRFPYKCHQKAQPWDDCDKMKPPSSNRSMGQQIIAHIDLSSISMIVAIAALPFYTIYIWLCYIHEIS